MQKFKAAERVGRKQEVRQFGVQYDRWYQIGRHGVRKGNITEQFEDTAAALMKIKSFGMSARRHGRSQEALIIGI
jgi:hypothetical protein